MLPLLLSLLAIIPAAHPKALQRKPVQILAHRGHPCKFPEETLEGYKSAIEMGVDYIELDVVSTSDSVLVARHDIILDESTDILKRAEFSGRNSSKKVEGMDIHGYFTIDFTYEELQQLNAAQRLPFRDQSANDKNLKIARLSEILKLINDYRKQGSSVGAYIETKAPSFHKEHDRGLEELLLADLKAADLLDPEYIYLQSFDRSSLEQMYDMLEKEGVKLPSTWLLECDDTFPGADDLATFSTIGTAIGPSKKSLVFQSSAPECNRTRESICADSAGQFCTGRLKSGLSSKSSQGFVEQAHAAGLEVHAYTFRNEGLFMALDYASSVEAELDFYSNTLKVDAVFVDCPETALRWRKEADCKRNNNKWPPSAIVIAILLSVTVTTVCFILWKYQKKDSRNAFYPLATKAIQLP